MKQKRFHRKLEAYKVRQPAAKQLGMARHAGERKTGQEGGDREQGRDGADATPLQTAAPARALESFFSGDRCDSPAAARALRFLLLFLFFSNSAASPVPRAWELDRGIFCFVF